MAFCPAFRCNGSISTGVPALLFAASIPLMMASLIPSKGLFTGGKITAILGMFTACAVDVVASV